MNIHSLPAALIEKARAVKLLLMDCDGVLTDGRLYFSEAGEAMKVFDVKDGQGFASWHSAGFRSGVITGRDAEKIISIRVKELGINYLRVRSANKADDLLEIIKDAGVSLEETAYVGDDIGDLSVMKLCGLAIAVADAADALSEIAVYTTKKAGGRGAVREVIDLLLLSKRS